MRRRRRIVHTMAIAAAFGMLVLMCGCQKQAPRTGSAGAKDAPSEVKRITFVELGSVNCIPCKAMQPLMERLREEYPDQVHVVFHDVWTEEGKPQARAFRVRVIPTQVFLDREGREYYRHEGYLPWEQILAALESGGLER